MCAKTCVPKRYTLIKKMLNYLPNGLLATYFFYLQRRMHVNVSALKIHLSEEAHDAVSAFPEFITEPRGDVLVKVGNDYNIVLRVIRSVLNAICER